MLHGLVLSDICPDDRQNFSSLEKIMRPHVANSLRECIPGSEATLFYLKLCYYVTSAFLDPKLSPSERIYRMWFAIFFLRIWRCWILQLEKSSKEPTEYCLHDNFITMNANECIELNGHALVQLVMKFRNENKSDLFIPSCSAVNLANPLFGNFGP